MILIKVVVEVKDIITVMIRSISNEIDLHGRGMKRRHIEEKDVDYI